MKSVAAIGQKQVLQEPKDSKTKEQFLQALASFENFYEEVGGIIGYQKIVLELLASQKPRFSVGKAQVHAPVGLDIATPSSLVSEAIYTAIESMETLCEIYPVGGAADRLRYQDEKTGDFMPAAFLPFNGGTLLSTLLQDLQAREYLYYKLNNRQITLPVALMTSKEKNNDERIRTLCAKSNWFHRPKELFKFFCQPLVPVVDEEGSWVLKGAMDPVLKPGGHGAIWKLAKDQGVFPWLFSKGASKAIIRQINNPIASEDYGLLAFAGHGLKGGKKFGFASCERRVGAAEGVNVIIEEPTDEGALFTLTNIEYCDFKIYGIQDKPKEEGGKYSLYPSNTNVLFVDLRSVEKAALKMPIPGMLINLKETTFTANNGEVKKVRLGRLESTMQNIADYFTKSSLSGLPSLDTYITSNKRRKTISTTKKQLEKGKGSLETPQGCFEDVIENRQELLVEHCAFTVPELESSAPPFLFSYHPALGPLYSVIGQKIQRGSLALGSELRLEIAECQIEDIEVDGSLHIEAKRVMGEIEEGGLLKFSENVGRCTLKRVKIENQGVDYTRPNVFWKQEIYRKETCKIILEGLSEFYAEDVTFTGDFSLTVEDGWRVTAKMEGEAIVLQKERLSAPSWRYHYKFTEDKQLVIEKG